jgi:hypothetical protein
MAALFAGVLLGATVRLRVEAFCFSWTGGGALAIRARICVWAVAVGTASKRKRKTRDVFFIMTLNSTSTLLLASGNDAELLARRATGLSMWINDERRLISGKFRKFPAGDAGTA